MKKYFNNDLLRGYLIPYSIAVFLFFVFNPQGLSFDYGSGNGVYADRVDSFSEYIVRNTIKRNVLSNEDSSLIPIITKGYGVGDYRYYGDGYVKYLSNLAFQTIPATILAKALGLDTEKKLDNYFYIIRLVNAFLLAMFVVGIFLSFCRLQNNNVTFLIPFVVGCSSGFIFFSQNLYFSSCLIVLPAFYISLQLQALQRFKKLPVFLFGVLYFLRGFEFSTIFALLTAFSAALFAAGSLVTKIKSALLGFVLICSAFVVSIMLHVIFISADSEQSVLDIMRLFLGNIQHRTQSLSGVPVPFGVGFMKEMDERWSFPAFSIIADGFMLSQLNVIYLMIFGMFIRLWRITDNEKIIYAYGFIGYSSWYIFAYQHIMWHKMYDWYIFALTIGISFGLLLIFYGSLAIDFFQGIHSRFIKND